MEVKEKTKQTLYAHCVHERTILKKEEIRQHCRMWTGLAVVGVIGLEERKLILQKGIGEQYKKQSHNGRNENKIK